MRIHFLGAAQTVTGSCYMMETVGARFAVDCGMHQGNKEIEKRNWETEYLKEKIDFFLITHAHIDHSGLLPLMVRRGFKGPIYCTEPTRDLLEIMLLDSAHIQEMEAEWENRRLSRKGKPLVEPLYTQADAAAAAAMIRGVSYNAAFEPAPGVKVTFRDAGHILGSAFLELTVQEAEGSSHLVFSGDLGRENSLLVNDPDAPRFTTDYLFMESTYGDRNHKDAGKSREELAEAIEYSYNRGGKVVIPAFAVERTQQILYTLHLLLKEGKLPSSMPVFLDSPLAIRATDVFRRHYNYADAEMQRLIAAGEDPLQIPNLRYTLTAEESQSINAVPGPAIIISASGMCNAGRIKHHLRHNIWNPKSCVVFVGYQGVGTPGRKIVDGAKTINLFSEELAVKAKIFTIGGFSGHAGQSQILNWVSRFTHPGMQVFLMHGEDKAQNVLAGLLREKFRLQVKIPAYLEEMTLAPGKQPLVQMDVQRAKPGVNWEVLLGDTEGKLKDVRASLNRLSASPWEEQVELRDLLLQVNSDLLQFLARTP